MKVAIYPGSFDPITNGHLDVLNRACKIFDKVIVLVAINPKKKSRFSPEERVAMIKEAVNNPNVEVDASSGLTVEYAKAHGATHLIRGLRAVTDFEYELQIAQTNKLLSGGSLDTIFLTTSLEYAYLSSSGVKEIAYFNGDISKCVPDFVADLVYEKYGHK